MVDQDRAGATERMAQFKGRPEPGQPPSVEPFRVFRDIDLLGPRTGRIGLPQRPTSAFRTNLSGSRMTRYAGLPRDSVLQAYSIFLRSRATWRAWAASPNRSG